MTIHAEHTDTYGGDANYSWVVRKQIKNAPDDLSNVAIVRRAKRALGITTRTRTTNYGDMFRLDLVGVHQCVFVTCQIP